MKNLNVLVMNHSFNFQVSSEVLNYSCPDSAVILNMFQREQLCCHLYNNVYFKAKILVQGSTDPLQDIAATNCGETGGS